MENKELLRIELQNSPEEVVSELIRRIKSDKEVTKIDYLKIHRNFNVELRNGHYLTFFDEGDDYYMISKNDPSRRSAIIDYLLRIPIVANNVISTVIKSDLLREDEFILIKKSNLVIFEGDNSPINVPYIDKKSRTIKTKLVIKMGFFYPEEIYYLYDLSAQREEKLNELS